MTRNQITRYLDPGGSLYSLTTASTVTGWVTPANRCGPEAATAVGQLPSWTSSAERFGQKSFWDQPWPQS